MDLIDRFDQKLWTSGDANTVEGFSNFRVGQKGRAVNKGEFIYAMFDSQGELKQMMLIGTLGDRDPLSGVGNVELKLSADEKEITGVMIADQCVLKKA